MIDEKLSYMQNEPWNIEYCYLTAIDGPLLDAFLLNLYLLSSISVKKINSSTEFVVHTQWQDLYISIIF